jgi:hypothetical protein
MRLDIFFHDMTRSSESKERRHRLDTESSVVGCVVIQGVVFGAEQDLARVGPTHRSRFSRLLRSIRPMRAADGYSTRKAPPETTRRGSSSFQSDDRTARELFRASIRDWEAAFRMGLMTTS